jgi:hypothetical protein
MATGHGAVNLARSEVAPRYAWPCRIVRAWDSLATVATRPARALQFATCPRQVSKRRPFAALRALQQRQSPGLARLERVKGIEPSS